MDSDKLVESVKFLLKTVRLLNERFVETNENFSSRLDSITQHVNDLADRLEHLEKDLLNWRDQELIAADSTRRPVELPARSDQQDRLIPALNLPLEGLLDVYRNTPVLLQPFARPCSVSGRTLSGEISEIELEVFAQGTTWVIETQDGEWFLLPRPGILGRQNPVKSLGRLFHVQHDAPCPADLELLQPGTASDVEHGRRWYLKEKGSIGVQPDPLQHSLEQRIRKLEEKFK